MEMRLSERAVVPEDFNLAEGPLTPEQVKHAADQIRMRGYVVLQEALPIELIERMRDRFDVLLEEYRARTDPNRGANRYMMYLPFEPPFADPRVYEHPAVLPILDSLLGPEMLCTYFSSDTPLPGADYQRVHSDTQLLFPDTTLSLPVYAVVLNIPLVDSSEENGSMEIWPGGTHLMPGPMDLASLAPTLPSQRLNVKAGSIVLRDARMWHRGTPHRGTRSRPNMALVYTRRWYRFEQKPFTLTRSAYDSLSERARSMFRHNVIVDG